MRAFARNASSRDEEDPESPTASVSGPNKQFHATKVSVMEATRACPYAFPKKIQEEMDRLADEQMLKLKEFVDPRGIRTPSPRRRQRDAIDAGSRAGTPCFPQTDAKRVKTPASPLRLACIE